MESAGSTTELPSPRRPRGLRRWFQFSLRSLLAAVTLTAIVLGAVVVPGERQRRAAKAILDAGGSVTYRVEGDTQPMGGSCWSGEPVRARLRLANWGPLCLLPLDYCDSVTSVSLYYRPIDELAVVNNALRHLPQLQSLTLSGSTIGDTLLSNMKDSLSLQVLNLNCTNCTDRTLSQEVRLLTQLRVLNLCCTTVTDCGMSSLAEIKSLRQLDLALTLVTDDGLAELLPLDGLVELRLGIGDATDIDLWLMRYGLPPLTAGRLPQPQEAYPITDAGLVTVSRFRQLEELYLGATQISDAGLAHLSGLQRLRELSLRKTQVTDAGMPHLLMLANLELLDLERTCVTEACLEPLSALSNLRRLIVPFDIECSSAVARFRAARPDCVVERLPTVRDELDESQETTDS